MTSVKDILKPKSKKELEDAIRHMHPYAFLDKFRKADISGMKLGFKKRLLYFWAITYIKIFSKIYWPIWILWVSIIVCSHIWEARTFITIPEEILNWVIIGSLIPTAISGFLNFRCAEWNRKHSISDIGHILHDVIQHQILEQRQEEERIREEEIRRLMQLREEETERQRLLAADHFRRLQQQQQDLDLMNRNLRNLL